MLLKITCDKPKVILPISLLFDDGTTKKVDVTEGMYATFVYMAHGASHEFTGMITDICPSAKVMTPFDPIRKKPGYLCDPDYVNSGVLGNPPFPPGPRPICPHEQAELDIRNYIEVKGVGRDCGKTIKIDIYSIQNIYTIYTEADPVKSPVDSTGIQMIRMTDEKLLQYTDNSVDWEYVKVAFSEDTEKLKETVDSMASEIEALKEEIAALKNNG